MLKPSPVWLVSFLVSEYRPVDGEAICGYVNNLCATSCALDTIPSSVFQRCQHRLVPMITRIVNLSLQGGQVPDRIKVGAIKPLGSLRKNDDHGYENATKQ